LARLCRRALPRVFELEMLDARWSRKARGATACFGQRRSSSLPGRTDEGCPRRSSCAPGCSPSSIARARAGSAPNTVCVAGRHSGQARHRRRRRAARDRLAAGTNSTAARAAIRRWRDGDRWLASLRATLPPSPRSQHFRHSSPPSFMSDARIAIASGTGQ
jgi:hypothetical protein